MSNEYLLQRINPKQLIFMRSDNQPLDNLNYEFYDLYYDSLKKNQYLTNDEICWLLKNVQINTFEDNRKILLVEADLVDRKTESDKTNPNYEIIEYKVFQCGGKEIDLSCTISNLMSQNEDLYLAENVSICYDLEGRIVRIVFSTRKSKKERKRLNSKERKRLEKQREKR